MWRIHHLPLIDCCLRKTGASYRLMNIVTPSSYWNDSISCFNLKNAWKFKLTVFCLNFSTTLNRAGKKTTHLEFFFHMRYGGKCFTMHPLWCPKAFLITFLGHDIGVVQDHLCSVSFFPQQLWGLPNIVSARRKRDINPQKNFSIFRTPAPGHAAIYSSRAHPSRTKQYKMRTYKKGTSIFW